MLQSRREVEVKRGRINVDDGAISDIATPLRLNGFLLHCFGERDMSISAHGSFNMSDSTVFVCASRFSLRYLIRS